MNLWQHIPAKREDVFSIGEGRCCISFGNSLLSLNHPTLIYEPLQPNTESLISLHGHGHAFYIYKKHISITSCSNLFLSKNPHGLAVPGFATLEDEEVWLTFKGYSLENNNPQKVLQYSFAKKDRVLYFIFFSLILIQILQYHLLH